MQLHGVEIPPWVVVSEDAARGGSNMVVRVPDGTLRGWHIPRDLADDAGASHVIGAINALWMSMARWGLDCLPDGRMVKVPREICNFEPRPLPDGWEAHLPAGCRVVQNYNPASTHEATR